MATKSNEQTAPAYKFGTGEVPVNTSGRAVEPTVFAGMFPTPVDENGKPSETITVTLTGKVADRDAEIRNLTNHARREASRLVDDKGEPAPLTANVKHVDPATGEKGHGKTETVVHIWTSPKITGRGRKPANAAE